VLEIVLGSVGGACLLLLLLGLLGRRERRKVRAMRERLHRDFILYPVSFVQVRAMRERLHYDDACDTAFEKLTNRHSRPTSPPSVDNDECGFFLLNADYLRQLAMERESAASGGDDDCNEGSLYRQTKASLVSSARKKAGTSGDAVTSSSSASSSTDSMPEATTAPLPPLQKLYSTGAVRFLRISKLACLRHLYAQHLLAVSHRWEAAAEPDPDGTQLRAVQEYLLHNPEIRYVWYDHWCMPQDERTEQQRADETTKDTRTVREKAEFRRMLGQVNLLYLGCRVLILLDRSYFSRFWTLFEAWLAMRKVTDQGLVEAHDSGKHYHVEVLYDTDTAGELRALLEKQWLDASWETARDKLAAPDIAVTNASDKSEQLEHLGKLDAYVRKHVASWGAMSVLTELSGYAHVSMTATGLGRWVPRWFQRGGKTARVRQEAQEATL